MNRTCFLFSVPSFADSVTDSPAQMWVSLGTLDLCLDFSRSAAENAHLAYRGNGLGTWEETPGSAQQCRGVSGPAVCRGTWTESWSPASHITGSAVEAAEAPAILQTPAVVDTVMNVPWHQDESLNSVRTSKML